MSMSRQKATQQYLTSRWGCESRGKPKPISDKKNKAQTDMNQ
jgi:hypothetical protein